MKRMSLIWRKVLANRWMLLLHHCKSRKGMQRCVGTFRILKC